MTKELSHVMLELHNVSIELSNVRKKIRELPNVRKELSHVMLELHNVKMKLSNVRKIVHSKRENINSYRGNKTSTKERKKT